VTTTAVASIFAGTALAELIKRHPEMLAFHCQRMRKLNKNTETVKLTLTEIAL